MPGNAVRPRPHGPPLLIKRPASYRAKYGLGTGPQPRWSNSGKLIICISCECCRGRRKQTGAATARGPAPSSRAPHSVLPHTLRCSAQAIVWHSRPQYAMALQREQRGNSFGSVSKASQPTRPQGAHGLAVCFATTWARSSPTNPLSSQYASRALFHACDWRSSSRSSRCQCRSVHVKNSFSA
jgi:hypothetical protein